MKFTGCLGIMVSSLILFLVCSFTFFSCVSSCNYTCQDKPVITPSRLVVKFGDPASATCVACQQACLPLNESIIDMEISLGTYDKNGSTVSWTVNQTTEWELTPICFYTTVNIQCCTNLPVTVYKPPESVSFSIKPSGPLSEGSEVILQCDVLNVAPAENLIVTFYRGQRSLGEEKSSNTAKKPVNEAFSSNYNISKEDNQVQFWCEAKLELGAEGPQPPLVVKSDNLTATVYYGPELKVPADPAPVSIVRGKPLHLTCVAEGNPKPRYNWTLPSNKAHSSVTDLKIDSVDFQDGGQYVCTVSSNGNSVSVRFDVTVQEPPESVSFSIKPSGPLIEGSVAILQCDVLNVAPAKNLTVTFYRGQRPLGEEKSSNTAKKPVNEAFSSSYYISKEDDQVQFWCEAKLELGAEGPQPPLVVKSEKTTVSVHWKPKDLETTSKPSDDAPRWKLCRFILCLTLLVSASV